MKLGLATSDWSFATEVPSLGGAGWYRLGLPGRHLVDTFEVVEGTLAFDQRSGVFGVRTWPEHPEGEATIEVPDVIVLQRWMFASIVEETRVAKAAGQVVVQDVDDNFWALDPRNRAAQTTDPQVNRIENREWYIRGIREASAVTVSTPALADALRQQGVRTRIEVLPNHVDTKAFEEIALEHLDAGPQLLPVVGWIGATPWRSGDLETLRGVLAPWFRRHPEAMAYHGGAVKGEDVTSFREAVGLPETVPYGERPLAPIGEYPDLFRPLDVGLVPLRDVAFNRAKSWIKGIEYAAAGVPFVAQDLPEYRKLQEDYGIGQVARRPKDWAKALDRLVDREEWYVEAASNLRAVKALDIRQGAHRWRDLYLDLLAST